MRYPEPITAGDTIGYAAPSFGANIEPYRSRFESALRYLKRRGFKAKLGPNVYEGSGIGRSNTEEACAAELMEAWLDPETAAIISVGGGELMCEILPHMDFEKIKEAPAKWYMGYSDNTNFTFLLPTLADTAAVYGPCASEFGMKPLDPALRDCLDLLTGKKLSFHGYKKWEKEELKSEEAPLLPYNLTEKTVVKRFYWDGTPFEGRLIGGCTDCLINLTGTRFDKAADFAKRYRKDGIIWFLESCDLNVFQIRRALWQMREAGWFRYVKGFLIGRPLCYGQEFGGLDPYNAVLGILEDYGVPVLMDVDLGHLPPKLPFISGGYVRVSPYGKDNITLDYELR